MWIWAPPRVPASSSTATQPDTRIQTPADFSRALLAALGDPNSGPNVQAINAWQAAEGGFVHLNPLNTTQPAAGATIWNSVGVRTYPDWKTAIRATVQTLKNGQYRGVLAALKGGNNAAAVAHAVGASPWGTGDFSGFISQKYAPVVNGTDLPVTDAMVAKAQAAGLDYVVVLLGSSDSSFTHQSFLDAFLPAAHAANIRVYGADVPNLADPKADVARAAAEITYTTPDQDRIDGFVADLDRAAGANPPLPAAQDYGNGLRFAVGPDFPLVAAVPVPPVPAPPPPAASYPYAQVASPFDAVAVLDPSSSPASQDLAQAMTALAPLGKPVIAVDQAPPAPIPPPATPPPPGSAPADPARDQVLAFMSAADDAKATSVSFWSWETASQSVFDAVGNAPQFSLPAAPAPMSASQVGQWQTLLSGLGFPAPTSGQSDVPTRAAIKAYQQAAHIPVTGAIDDATRESMLTPFPPPLPAALLASSLAAQGGVVGPGGAVLPLPRQYLKNGSVDEGVDYSVPGGTPLYAMGSGTIIQEGISGFGPDAPVLQITSGPLAGRTVYYGHSGRDLVPVGAHVVQGQQISVVGYGIVGISTGPHLEIGFLPLGRMGAGQSMLDYINAVLPSIGG
jgi:murein DD-endopeptidase MepM/ murein hydrolase activator NlpD